MSTRLCERVVLGRETPGVGRPGCCHVVGILGGVGEHYRPMKAVDVGASESSERWTTIAKAAVTGLGFRVEVFSPSAAL